MNIKQLKHHISLLERDYWHMYDERVPGQTAHIEKALDEAYELLDALKAERREYFKSTAHTFTIRELLKK